MVKNCPTISSNYYHYRLFFLYFTLDIDKPVDYAGFSVIRTRNLEADEAVSAIRESLEDQVNSFREFWIPLRDVDVVIFKVGYILSFWIYSFSLPFFFSFFFMNSHVR